MVLGNASGCFQNVLEYDRGVEKGSVPSVSLVVSAAEKMEVAECVEEAAERSEGHLRRVIWRVGEKTKGGKIVEFLAQGHGH